MDHLTHYTVEIDTYGIDENTMTDTGVRVGDLEPIEDCSLTPGNPSPVGRTEDGDLAYVITPKSLYVNMSAAQAADLIKLAATDIGLEKADDLDWQNDNHKIILNLLCEALPKVFFEDSAHAQMAYKIARDDILTKGAKALPDFLL